MNIVLIPIAGLLIIVLVFTLKSIPKKENNRERILKAILIILTIALYVAICVFLPNPRA